MKEIITKRIKELDEEIERIQKEDGSLLVKSTILTNLRTRREELGNLLIMMRGLNELEDAFNIIEGEAGCLEEYDKFNKVVNLLDEIKEILSK